MLTKIVKSRAFKVALVVYIIAQISFLVFGAAMYELADSSVKVVKSTHARERLDNPNKFVSDCYIDDEYYSSYTSNFVKQGALTLYDKLGVQFYFINIKVPKDLGFMTDNEINDYCTQWLDENIPNLEYCIVNYSTEPLEVPDAKYGGFKYIYVSHNFFYGDKAIEVLDSEGMAILKSSWDRYVGNWRYENLPKFANVACKRLVDYKDYSILITVITIAVGLVIAAVLVILFIHKMNSKKRAEDLKILNTSLDDLTEDHLTSKYLNEGGEESG